MIRRLLGRRRFERDHRFSQAHMSDYVDEELRADQRRRVEAHVGVCPECRHVLATLRRTLEGLRSLGSQPRPGIAEGVIDRLRHS